MLLRSFFITFSTSMTSQQKKIAVFAYFWQFCKQPPFSYRCDFKQQQTACKILCLFIDCSAQSRNHCSPIYLSSPFQIFHYFKTSITRLIQENTPNSSTRQITVLANMNKTYKANNRNQEAITGKILRKQENNLMSIDLGNPVQRARVACSVV